MSLPRPSRGRTGLLVLAAIALAGGLWEGLARIPTPWAADGTARSCRVDHVYDGDSLRLICRGGPKEVRLHCIDAPERAQRPWAERSRAHLIAILPARVDLVERDRDRYDRIVGDLYAPGSPPRLLNLGQVEAGQAAVYDRYCNDRRFARAELEARKARRGIWSRPGEQQTPWTFRHR